MRNTFSFSVARIFAQALKRQVCFLHLAQVCKITILCSFPAFVTFKLPPKKTHQLNSSSFLQAQHIMLCFDPCRQHAPRCLVTRTFPRCWVTWEKSTLSRYFPSVSSSVEMPTFFTKSKHVSSHSMQDTFYCSVPEKKCLETYRL